MNCAGISQEQRKHQQDLERLRQLRPIDDDFMRCLFKDNIPLVQFVLRIITGKPDLIITECQTQKDLKRLVGGRTICLDALGTDLDEKKYDMEIQREDRGACPFRARFHSSALDIENLDAGQDFRELPETYTIFITEKDFFGAGEPFYPIERINLTTKKPFDDGEHILYVNGAYRGESEIGRLMHDFCCASASEMNFPLMAERTRYLKETPKGVSEMCQIIETMRREEWEEGRKEGRKEGAITAARRMLRTGRYAPEEVCAISGLTMAEVKALAAELG